MLEEEGYEVGCDGRRRAKSCASRAAPARLVILDIVMPETDGLTAAEHIVEQGSWPPS